MKKTFKFFAAALAIIAAASCAKEISNDDIQAPEQELVHKVFTASLNVDPETKTTLHEDGVTVHWTENDVIKLFPKGSANGTDFSVVSCDGVFADFEGETVNADSYRAVYPASALLMKSIGGWYTEKNYYIFADYSSKCALAHQHAVENNFSVIKELGTSSNYALSTSSEDGHLSFKNINAYLKIRLAMDNAASIEVSADKVLSHSSGGAQNMLEGAKLGGPITIDFANSNKVGVLAGNGEDITFKKADGSNLLSGDDIYYYIAIPAVKIEGLKLVVKDANGKVLQTLTKKSTFSAEPNVIYDLGIIEEVVEPAKVGDYFYSDGTYSTVLDNSKTVVGVVFYVGNPAVDDEALRRDYPNCIHGLVVSKSTYSGVVSRQISWGTSPAVYFGGSGAKRVEPAASLMTGYYNTSCVRSVDPGANAIQKCEAEVKVAKASAWYMPTIAEFDKIAANIVAVNKSLESISSSWTGDYTFKTKAYWTVSEEDRTYAATYTINGNLYSVDKTQSHEIRPIFAF